MRGAAARETRTVWRENVPADESRRHTERPGRLHHEHGKIPATAPPASQGLIRRLHALLDAARVRELDRECRRVIARSMAIVVGGIRRIEKLQCPFRHAFRRIMREPARARDWESPHRNSEKDTSGPVPRSDTRAASSRNAPGTRRFRSAVRTWSLRTWRRRQSYRKDRAASANAAGCGVIARWAWIKRRS